MLADSIQQRVETRCRHMWVVHEAAMASRAARDREWHKSELAFVGQQLDELIAYVEQVIAVRPAAEPGAAGRVEGNQP